MFETVYDYTFDGLGRLIKSTKTLNKIYQIPTQGTPKSSYQIWSSVLNDAVVKLDQSGNKLKTNVYAGGAIIAEQQESNGSYKKVSWMHADPVSGSMNKVGKDGITYIGELGRTEYEPMGQTVSEIDPEDLDFDEEPPSYGDGFATAGEPEWHCDFGFGGGFFDIPNHCKTKFLEDAGNGFWLRPEDKKEGNPANVADDNHDNSGGAGPAATPTDKPLPGVDAGGVDAGEVVPDASLPNNSGGPTPQQEDTDEEIFIYEDVLDMSTPADYAAAHGRDKKKLEKVKKSINDAVKLLGSECGTNIKNFLLDAAVYAFSSEPEPPTRDQFDSTLSASKLIDKVKNATPLIDPNAVFFVDKVTASTLAETEAVRINSRTSSKGTTSEIIFGTLFFNNVYHETLTDGSKYKLVGTSDNSKARFIIHEGIHALLPTHFTDEFFAEYLTRDERDEKDKINRNDKGAKKKGSDKLNKKIAALCPTIDL